MHDLIKQLKEKAGLTEDQAQKALVTIKEYIQSKLPPVMHGMVDNFMGNMPDDDDADDIADAGSNNDDWKKKAEHVTNEAAEKLEDLAEDAKQEAEDFAKEATEKISEWAVKAESAAEDAINKLKDMLKENGSKTQ